MPFLLLSHPGPEQDLGIECDWIEGWDGMGDPGSKCFNDGFMKCEVKWALERITTNKASRGDGIPLELFQLLKDDAVKVLHSICQQIWKTHQWPQDWKRCMFDPSLRV